MATKLTQKQQKFVDEYLVDLNATQAAIRAGYSKKTAKDIGCENLAKPYISHAIEEALDAIHTAKVADATEVMEYLTAVLRGEYTEEVPILVGDGCQSLTDKSVGAKERLKAAELIGKRHGLFTDKLKVEGAIPVVIYGGNDLED